MAQYSILRRYWLPDEPDSVESMAAAAWLDNRYWENMTVAVSNGIVRAIKGK
ncbi:DUF6890 family protein [Lelliottia aquatilis]|uniref:DUF6890 family protein n=1 Tax=Lelliottia aquatilis TaxID=2080838 RepID=UPI00192B0021|nr:hypothetical protein [Lelliottia aquatilis]ELN2578707.1 hypothetical protein [Enterobacter kobei]MBL5884856.1 hypothetical protein [Lelliottia aquatilis]